MTGKCPFHGDPVFSDPDSLLVKKTKDQFGTSYIHYENVGSTGLNQHVNHPEVAENIRKWYAARGLGVRLVKKSAAGCPYYAVYIGKPLRGVRR